MRTRSILGPQASSQGLPPFLPPALVPWMPLAASTQGPLEEKSVLLDWPPRTRDLCTFSRAVPEDHPRYGIDRSDCEHLEDAHIFCFEQMFPSLTCPSASRRQAGLLNKPGGGPKCLEQRLLKVFRKICPRSWMKPVVVSGDGGLPYRLKISQQTQGEV